MPNSLGPHEHGADVLFHLSEILKKEIAAWVQKFLMVQGDW